jgi:rhodanese-related sulfurtransferase
VPIERISAREAHEHLRSQGALLVCAYDSEEKFHQNHLGGAISLDELRSREGSLPRTQELIFYCA